MNLSKLLKKYSFDLSLILIFIVSVFSFLLTYYAFGKSNAYEHAIIIKDVIFSILILFFGIFFKNLKQLVVVALIYSFAGYCDSINTITYSFILVLISLFISLIIHLLFYKEKLKINKYTLSFLAIFLCFGCGGLFCNDENFIFDSQRLITIIFRISAILIFFCVFFISNHTKVNFIEIAKSMSMLNLLICFEIIIKASSYIGAFEKFMSENFYLIWGMKNTICIPVMMTLPFVLWFVFQNTKFKFLYIIQAILNLFSIFLMFSRTAFIFFIPELLLVLIGGISYKFKINFKISIKKILIGILIVCLTLFCFYIFYKDEIYKMFTTEIFFRLNTFFSRVTIWKRALEIYRDNQWFGIGYIGSFNFYVDVGQGAYQAVHQTIFQVLFLSGNFGLIIFMYHIYTKYSKLFYKMNFDKFIIFVSYLSAAAIGLVDLTYFQTIFLLLLIPLMIFTESIVDDEKTIYLF